MSDEIIFKSCGHKIYKKKIRGAKDLDVALDDLRRKMF